MTKTIAIIALLASSIAMADQQPKPEELSNRLFVELEALSSGLQLRTGQIENDGSASEGAQIIEAVTQGCEHKNAQSKKSKTDSLGGAECPVGYKNTLTVVSAKSGALKLKATTNTTVTKEPLLSVLDVRSDVSTADISVVENEKLTSVSVTENHKVGSVALKNLVVKRTTAIAQNKVDQSQKVAITAIVTGALKVNASFALTIKAQTVTADCKLNGKAADCEVVGYILGMPSAESKEPGQGGKAPVIERALRAYTARY